MLCRVDFSWSRLLVDAFWRRCGEVGRRLGESSGTAW